MGNSKNNKLPGKGDVIKGQYGTYELINKLGHGGNGVVFDVRVINKKSELPASKTGYVVKILNIEKFNENNREKRIWRFEKEIRAVQSLEHQGLRIIPIYDSCLNSGSEQAFEWYLMPKAKDFTKTILSDIDKLIQFRELGDTIRVIHKKNTIIEILNPKILCCLMGLVASRILDLYGI